MPRLRIVRMNTPWMELRNKLTGDPINDSRAVFDFCATHKISKATALARIALFDREAKSTVQNENIKRGRAAPKRAGA